MIGEILQAVLDECDALLSGTGATVMLKTNFPPKKIPDNSGNFILLALDDAVTSGQYPGGLTQMDWRWSFNSYSYEPDAYVDDHSGYSTALLDFIDTIRQHFSSAGLTKPTVVSNNSLFAGKQYTVRNGSISYNNVIYTANQTFVAIENVTQYTIISGEPVILAYGWLTPGMAEIFTQWGFQFTLTGLTNADPVDEQGLIMGYKIGFDSTALDNTTQYTEQDIILETVTQIDNPPFSPGEQIS